MLKAKKELKIGQKGRIAGVQVVCREFDPGGCEACAFLEDCLRGADHEEKCAPFERKDGKSVYFEKVEKDA